MSNRTAAFQVRLANLKKTFAPHQAVLVSNPQDIRYFCGFATLVPQEREALLLISHHSVDLFYAHFSPFVPVEGITNTKGASMSNVYTKLSDLHQHHGLTELLIDEANLYVSEYRQLLETLTISPLPRNTIWELRMVKDADEHRNLNKAGQIAQKVLKKVLPGIQAGQTELELCHLLENELQKHGSEAPAFPTIVAFGSHTALPHHQPTTRTLKTNMPILIDFGATFDGYRSDMTRTWWFGDSPDLKFREIEQLVKDAYQAALTVAQNLQLRTAKAIDKAARDLIAEQGYGELFIHTTGHGVGLDIHEPPSLNWNSETPIQPGMVITIEPGIYLENKFGYRYENTVRITNESAEELTT